MDCGQLLCFQVILSKNVLTKLIQKNYIKIVCESQFKNRYSIQDFDEGIILTIEKLKMLLYHSKTVDISIEPEIDAADATTIEKPRDIIRHSYYSAPSILI